MSAEQVLDQPVRSHHSRVPFAPAVAIYIAARLLTLLVVAVANLFTHHGLVSDLSIWDGRWFLQAVQHGWPSVLPRSSGVVEQNPVAFFPLFPLVLRGLSDLLGLSGAVVGLFVSAISGLFAVIAIGLLARAFTDERRANRAAVLFALSPGGFVFSLLYAEGMLVTFVALGLLMLLRRRWLLAGLLGALATFTSPVGIAFVVSCVVVSGLALVRDRDWRSLLAPLLAPAGLIAWMGYLWTHTGDLMAWRLTEHDGWQSYPSLLYPLKILMKFLFNPLAPTMTGQILFVGTLVGIFGLVVMFREHQPVPILTYGLTAVLLFAFTTPVGLRPRFLMLAFPIAVGFATRFDGWRYRAIVVVFAVVLCLITLEELSSYAVFP